MEKKQNNKSEAGLSVKGQRYWSIMLVGEHGRVIPFRRFKEVVIAVAGIIVLSLSAALVLSVLYFQQANQVDHLQAQLDEQQKQAIQLKDERDVLRAKLVIRELSTDTDASQATPKEMAQSAAEPVSSASQSSTSQPASEVKPAPAAKPTAPETKWKAEIKRFEAKYDDQREILRATFRIYNISTPRERLSGRIVIAFKHSDDPPIKWLVVPNIPLKEGKPAMYAGQAFSIQNYQTMDFKSYKPPSPYTYDLATVYVLLSNGELLMSHDFGIDIKEPPPAEPTPSPTPSPRSEPGQPAAGAKTTPEDEGEVTPQPAGQHSVSGAPAAVGRETGTSDAESSSPQDNSNRANQPANAEPDPSMAVPNVPNSTVDGQPSHIETQSKPEGETE